MHTQLTFVYALMIIASLIAFSVGKGQTIPPSNYLPIIRNGVAGTATPTSTIAIVPTITATPTPTSTSTPTRTPTLTPTATQVVGPCPCSADTLNCSDFDTHDEAQACFDFCVSQGAGDIHRLDSDNNGVACEALPLGWQVWK